MLNSPVLVLAETNMLNIAVVAEVGGTAIAEAGSAGWVVAVEQNAETVEAAGLVGAAGIAEVDGSCRELEVASQSLGRSECVVQLFGVRSTDPWILVVKADSDAADTSLLDLG